MPNTTDEQTAQELAQDHPPAWSSVFGDEAHASAYMPQDQPAPPGPRSTAALHTNRVRQGEQDARRDQDLTRIAASAREQAEDEALLEAQRLNRAGQAVPAGIRSMAARALDRRGVRVSSAEQMAGPTLARLRREAQAQDQDTDDRRRGRRPRR